MDWLINWPIGNFAELALFLRVFNTFSGPKWDEVKPFKGSVYLYFQLPDLTCSTHFYENSDFLVTLTQSDSVDQL